MRLKSLCLKNFRQYKDSTIEFSDGITGIVGLNGAGKSTIVEAIAWTLYGNNGSRTGKNEGIKRVNTTQSANVECQLLIEIGGIEYRIVRILKGSSQSGDASVIANGKVIADSVKAVEKEVLHLLGMDWKSFNTSFFARQKELNALTEQKPAERRDTVMRMLRIDAIDVIIQKIRERIKAVKIKIDILDNSMKATKADELIPEHIIEGEITKLTRDLNETNKELTIIERQLVKLDKEKSEFNARFNEIWAQSEKYNKLKNKINAFDERVNNNLSRRSECNNEMKELNVLENELPSLEIQYSKYKELSDKASQLRAIKDNMNNSNKSKTDIKNRLSQLVTEANDLLSTERKLKTLGKCPTCGQKVPPEIIDNHIKEEKERIKNERDRLKSILITEQPAFNQNEYDEILSKIKEYQPAFDKYPEIKAHINRKPKILDSLAKLEAERQALTEQIKATTKELNSIQYDEKKHGDLTKELEIVDQELKRKYEERNEVNLEIKELATQIKEKNTQLENMAAKKKQKEALKRERETYEHFQILVTDYRQFLISRIRPKLSEITGHLLAELTDGKYTGAELDDEYNIWIFDGNVKFPLQRFSGGEADIANLCLRLAISQLITESSGTETGFIILDEIFGSQDALRKNAILEALNRLSTKFRQIILITHIDDVKDTLENLIEIAESEDGVSFVKSQ